MDKAHKDLFMIMV